LGETVEADKATEEWLNSQQKSETKRHYATYWARFLEYVGMSGDAILADRKLDTEHRWEKKVLDFKAFLVNEKKVATYSATLAAMACRSFFSYHYATLQYRTPEKRKLRERARKTADYQFSLTDLQKMCAVGDLTERYVVTGGKSFGLRAGDFLRLTRGDVEPYLDREAPISIGEFQTQKESVRAFPFIDTDLQPVLKLVIERMTREGRTQPNERILNYKRERQLSRILQRLTKKAGIVTGNKEVRFHTLRKFLADRLSSVMSESKWKQVIGKEIDEAAYISAESLREDYKRAMPETTFTKIEATSEDARKEAALSQLRALGYTEEKLEYLRGHLRTGDETLEDLERTLKEEMTRVLRGHGYRLKKSKILEDEDDCEDGQHCQRIVAEEDLGPALEVGWRVVATLPSGKIVIER
jgi:hypothetical protein